MNCRLEENLAAMDWRNMDVWKVRVGQRGPKAKVSQLWRSAICRVVGHTRWWWIVKAYFCGRCGYMTTSRTPPSQSP